MFEVLVHRRSYDKTDLSKPNPIAWSDSLPKRGDIVAVGDEGHSWGKRESLAAWSSGGGSVDGFPDDFVMLQVASTHDHEHMKRVLVKRAEIPAGEDGEVQAVYRHMWRVNFDELPEGWRSQQAAQGFVSLTWQEFQSASENKLERCRLATSLDSDDDEGIGSQVPNADDPIEFDRSVTKTVDGDEPLGGA